MEQFEFKEIHSNKSELVTAEIHIRSYSTVFHSHDHYFSQWVLPLRGSLAIEIEGKSGIVCTNQAVYVAPEQKHCFAGQDKNLFLVLNSPNSGLFSLDRNIPAFWELSRPISEFLTFIYAYISSQRNLPTTSYLIKDFLITLLRQEFKLGTDSRIEKAKMWIDTHYATPISVTRVAKECFLSQSQLQRRFYKVMKLNIGEYWCLRRMEKAKELLMFSPLSIERISEKVGYDSINAFSTRFTKSCGVSPSKWRNLYAVLNQ